MSFSYWTSLFAPPKMEPDCKSMEVFKEGIGLVINFWRQIRYFVEYQIGGRQSSLKVDQLCDRLFSSFIQSRDSFCIPSAKKELKIAIQRQILLLLDIHLPTHRAAVEIEEVSKQLMDMYKECLQGNFSSVEVIKEANARRLMRKQVNKIEREDPFVEMFKKINRRSSRTLHKIATGTASIKKIKKDHVRRIRNLPRKVNKFGMGTPSDEIVKEVNISRCRMQANSSKMDDSRVVQGDRMGVFKEGVDLYVENLWARLDFLKKHCGPDPSPMLQELADEILFWFTQTIKPLSLAYIEWILMNVMYPFHITFDATNKAITKEVAKKLMVMYEECLQGNFRSVEILREESQVCLGRAG